MFLLVVIQVVLQNLDGDFRPSSSMGFGWVSIEIQQCFLNVASEHQYIPSAKVRVWKYELIICASFPFH